MPVMDVGPRWSMDNAPFAMKLRFLEKLLEADGSNTLSLPTLHPQLRAIRCGGSTRYALMFPRFDVEKKKLGSPVCR